MTPTADDSSPGHQLPGQPHSCAGFAALLSEVERTSGGASPEAALTALGRHATACFPCRTRHRARLGVVEGFCALRARAVPDGLLDDFSDCVLARTRGVAPGTLGAAGMSPAFLDAPRSLATWRWTAVAASLLLTVGGGLWASGRLAWRGAEAPPAAERDGALELRDALLDRLDARGTDEAPAATVQPVDFLTRGSNDYWSWRPYSGRVILRPVPAAERPVAGPPSSGK